MGFHDVTVQFPWRHARNIHVYGCSRKYEIIDPSKQPMRFTKFCFLYDKRPYYLSGAEIIYINETNKLWDLKIAADILQWSKIKIYVDIYVI